MRQSPNSPYRYYWKMLTYKMISARRQVIFKNDPSEPDSAITEDRVLDNLVIHGSVNSVVDQILRLREEVGDFGELVYAGMDWVDPQLAKRSMALMANEVMPRVNAAIAAGGAGRKVTNEVTRRLNQVGK